MLMVRVCGMGATLSPITAAVRRGLVGNWIKYAAWEDKNQEYARARSVYERALDVEYRNVTLWLKYAEMEMRQKQVNHARNIWDRAVTILPRSNVFWQK